ncbi:MAG: hypothetical protein EOP87_23005 [Verrucomicrobiaceae bacterium]|nr:MAG: hypothetical protein EOP87_23005 [Verrucomicrobiaceae bacterium]
MKKFAAGMSGLGICVLCFVAGMNTPKPGVADVMKPAAVEDPDVRVVKNQDGSRDVFIRSGSSLITRHRFGTDAKLFSRSAYRVDYAGNPMSCKIYDPDGGEVLKVVYGYRRKDGKLVEERVFNTRTKTVDKDGKELPVHRMIHLDDGETLSIFPDEADSGLDIARRVDSPFRNPFVN